MKDEPVAPAGILWDTRLMASDGRNPYVTATTPSRWPSFLIGVGAALVVMVPGWLTGGGLQVPTRWDAERLTGRRPFAFLPLDLDHVFPLFATLVLGGVLAGLIVRMLRRRRPVQVWPAVWGVLLAQLAAAVQSFIALLARLGIGGGSEQAVGAMLMDGTQLLYLLGLVLVVVVGLLFAQLGLLFATRRSPAFGALAVALAAPLVTNWIGGPLVVFVSIDSYPEWLAIMLRWLPAVIVGLALVWCGVRPWGRLSVWVIGLAALWVMPAAITSISYAVGIRAIQNDPQEIPRAIAQYFVPMLHAGVAPVVVALVIGVVGTVVRMLVRRSPVSPGETAEGA